MTQQGNDDPSEILSKAKKSSSTLKGAAKQVHLQKKLATKTGIGRLSLLSQYALRNALDS
eukprot:CAMPEP_0170482626 /NCGR_PEP_ID=MMETSP0208-20121228/2563_1 /TAXON_ID=197538 /ORGANISM="Strombidium inclinatum, Strain S3" /LENGTH=59 /DNA_ID=CAMNT_0010755483 /DNA_START=237 /DNA_END=416 /DNA_ORIENTATION=-